MRTAYSYLRFSTPEQMKGDSQRRQLDGAQRACAQFGWQLSDTSYRDLGVSSYRGDNRKKGDLALFIKALENGDLEKGAVLILEDFDRLSRDKIMASIDLVRRILEGGIDLFCTMNWRLYTRGSLNEPMSIMEMIWRFYLAHEESEKKAVRSRANWRQKREEAPRRAMTSICPGWLRLVGGQFEQIPERVRVVRDIFDWCVGGLGVQSIARKLNRQRVPAFRTVWGQRTVHQILTDGRVLGHLPSKLYGEKVTDAGRIVGYYPAVIDQQTFDAANDCIQARKLNRGRPAAGGFVNLFTGLVHYPEHDCSMVLVTKTARGHRHRYLTSYKGFRGMAKTVYVPYAHAEHVLLKWIRELKAADVVPGPRPDRDAAPEADSSESELVFVTARIRELADSLEKLGTPVASVVQKLAALESRKSELMKEIRGRPRTPPPLEETVRLVDLLSSATGKELTPLREKIRQRLGLLIDRIDVSFSVWAEDPRRKQYTFCVRFKKGLTRTVYFRTGPNGELVQDGLLLGADGQSDFAALDALTHVAVGEEERRRIDAGILEFRRSGKTYEEIRAEFGVSKQRIWSVCRAAGLVHPHSSGDAPGV